MSLRDQPYLPLYVQDYLTDEKLNMCSASTQGVYVKIMCIFHKSEKYGGILLKKKYKQNKNTGLNFASMLVRLLPFDLPEIESALIELLEERVLKIDGDFLFQKRMVEDNELSVKRSVAGKKGGRKSKTKQKDFAKAKSEANSEYENEYVNEYVIPTKKESVREKVNFKDLENTQWFESILRFLQMKINLDDLLIYWKQFQDGMIADDDLYRDKDDYRSHFRNWIKIQIDNEANRKKTRNGFESDSTKRAIESVKNGFK